MGKPVEDVLVEIVTGDAERRRCLVRGQRYPWNRINAPVARRLSVSWVADGIGGPSCHQRGRWESEGAETRLTACRRRQLFRAAARAGTTAAASASASARSGVSRRVSSSADALP